MPHSNFLEHMLRCVKTFPPFPFHTGVYSHDQRQLYDLKDPAWKHDIMPEVRAAEASLWSRL
eukprot:1157637-Pelagomonas_calceolata.AAC.5